MSGDNPDTVAVATVFIEQVASHANQLFILGDLFEYWVGDDMDCSPCQPFLSALRRLSANGTRVTVMHGNRDFLLGQQFARDYDVTVVDEDQILQPLSAGKVLLMHGDTLCTDDHGYQQLRERLRSPSWQQHFLSQPLQERENYARMLRSQSATESGSKPVDIMDVNQQAVSASMSKAQVDVLIHGHTHRPDTHQLTVDGRQAIRYVVGDWQPSGAWYVAQDGGELSLRYFSQ